MGCLMLARVEDLPKTPGAFQEYVKDWFKEKSVLGVPCVVAEGQLFVDFNFYERKGKSPGCAPSHSVDLASYKAGLPKGQSLNDWIRKSEGAFVWTFYTSDHRERSFLDED